MAEEQLAAEAFAHFPYGLVIFDGNGYAVSWNDRAAELVGEIGASDRCCSLVCDSPDSPLDGRCFTEIARAREAPLPEVRVDLTANGTSHSVWVTAARLGERQATLLELRPGEPGDRRRRTQPHWVTKPRLHIRTLGQTRVESVEGELRGRWLAGRAGQILKLLATKRGRPVPTDEIVEAIWPGSDVTAGDNVRYYIHVLRDRIEPNRPKRAPSSFVVSLHGGYALDPETTSIDADAFESKANAGLRALRNGDGEEAVRLLGEAVAMYGGDFLQEEAYAPWALRERDRLRNLASESLRALARVCIRSANLDGAAPFMERLAGMQPLDEDVQRQAIALALARGKRSDATRIYTALRSRVRTEFDEEPVFEFGDVRPAEIDDV